MNSDMAKSIKNFPFVVEIVLGLIDIEKDLDRDTEDVPVRLQVDNENGTWRLWSGDPCYDTDHKGSWGAGTISPEISPADRLELARELWMEALDELRTLNSLEGG